MGWKSTRHGAELTDESRTCLEGILNQPQTRPKRAGIKDHPDRTFRFPSGLASGMGAVKSFVSSLPRHCLTHAAVNALDKCVAATGGTSITRNDGRCNPAHPLAEEARGSRGRVQKRFPEIESSV